MASWKDYLKKDQNNKEYPEKSQIDKSISPSERMIQKSSKGSIEESDAWGIKQGGGYLERDIKLSGVYEEDLWCKYQFNSWTRACVDKIIKEAVKYKVVVKSKDPDRTEDPKVKEHIKMVESLLSDPNENIESFDDIRRKYLRDILVYDAGAVEIVYDGGVPKELYDIRGSNVRLNLDKHGNFKSDETAYKLIDPNDVNNCQASWNINEMIYMIANPVSGSAYGLSPIETLWSEIENDNEASEYNRKLLKNAGMITGVLSFANMPSKNVQRNQRLWGENVRKKGNQLVVTNNPDVKFVRVTEKQSDMQFMEFQKWLLNKIMAVYGMQPIVLGVVDETTGKLNSSEQREQFKQDAILPLLKLEAHRFTNVLISIGFGFDDVVLSHIEPAGVDESFDLEKTKVGCQYGFITINEARAWINLPPLKGEEGKRLVNDTAIKYIQSLVEKDQSHDDLETVKAKIEDLLQE